MHHRDDTEETRTYNEEYYERWGCNEDGAFEYGKYVIFMPKSEHMRYHVIGRHHTDEARAQISAAHKGKKLSAEHRAKVSANNACYWKGKKFSDETRTKMSANNSRKSVKVLYSVYKNNGGMLKWNAFQTVLKNGDITFSDYKITIIDDNRR